MLLLSVQPGPKTPCGYIWMPWFSPVCAPDSVFVHAGVSVLTKCALVGERDLPRFDPVLTFPLPNDSLHSFVLHRLYHHKAPRCDSVAPGCCGCVVVCECVCARMCVCVCVCVC